MMGESMMGENTVGNRDMEGTMADEVTGENAEFRHYAPAYNALTRSLLQDFAQHASATDNADAGAGDVDLGDATANNSNTTGSESTANVVLSPMSVLMLLGIAADASQGATRQQIVDAIGADMPYSELIELLAKLQASYTHDDTVKTANAVCVRNDLADAIQPGYAGRLRYYFYGKLFDSPNPQADVNGWVSEHTDGMVGGISVPPDVVACLMNAIAFKSYWEDEFDPGRMRDDHFRNADGTVTDLRMLRSTESTYVEDADFTGFVKPYEDPRYAFIAALPRKTGKAALTDALDRLDFTKLYEGRNPKPADFDDRRYSGYEYKVEVTMPEFDGDISLNLADWCTAHGMGAMFAPGVADFSPMCTVPLYVSAAEHKVHIKVTRSGTEAAAFSWMGMKVTGVQMAFLSTLTIRKKVRLGRPFAYAIMDTSTHLPVFAGICRHIDK